MTAMTRWFVSSCLFFALLLTINPAISQGGLQASAVAYPGAFATNDPGSNSACYNGNALTGVCTCAGNLPDQLRFRVINDAQGLRGGFANFCAAGTPTGGSEFRGGFQFDDAVPGGQGCRVANANTGDCSCPAGSAGVYVRALTDSAVGIIGSTVVICHQVTSTPFAFGGAFQRDDWGTCRHGNPNTGSCSCTSGFVEQAQRVIVDGPLGAHLYTCVPPLNPVQVCPGVWAYPSGAADSSAAIQQCLNNYSTVELPVGTYRVDSRIVIDSPRVFRTQGTAGSGARCLQGTPCAALTASSNFNQPEGFFGVSPTAGGSLIDHIILDGNRSGRVNSPAWTSCQGGANRYGFNAVFRGASTYFQNSASINAVCGTGLEWFAYNAVVMNSIFAGNGDVNLFGDGLTLLRSDAAWVTNNAFLENTDIGFIFGGGNDATIAYNYVENRSRFAFAGMMMDNFNLTTLEGLPMGVFFNTTFYGNWIECDRCSFAMNVGPYPWYTGGGPIYYGTLSNNTFRGGHISLNVDGVGNDPSNGITVVYNSIGPNLDQGIGCMAPAVFNFNPGTSFLHPSSTVAPTSYQNTIGCHR